MPWRVYANDEASIESILPLPAHGFLAFLFSPFVPLQSGFLAAGSRWPTLGLHVRHALLAQRPSSLPTVLCVSTPPHPHRSGEPVRAVGLL